MRIGRAIIIPAIAVLGMAGTILAGPEMAMAAVSHAPVVHSHSLATSTPNVFYHN